ncbi:dimethyl sulfoxide reductase anchor subunit family protein [Thioalkalivibrio thiocyanodenitrificans]|uniref:dimethyl sulfoxide reductase anchor subunit family protein n=1 Tax=Thioalkalivibrio thiocyanodenitrificans TaxID=243063 RepID=UPI00036F2A77|nr:DmsC/YnfH family molybdoenzyme membrane anchor subunit [Thioalkalivibrio thiocyanodenitrificans]
MHPAFSVIFLTTLIGAGQGLFIALSIVEFYAALRLLPEHASPYYAVGAGMSLALLALGLLASFFHLGHPERAWRAAAMWRTSWLSREVIVLPVMMGIVFLYGAVHLIGINPVLFTLPGNVAVPVTLLLAAIGALAAVILYVTTAMIYACLRFLQEWHSPLTVANYTLLGLASGFTLAAAHAAYMAVELVHFLAAGAVIFTLLGLISRTASLIRNARLKAKSTLQTATGIKHPNIVQKSQGFMGGSFNTREFFHGMSEMFVRSVKWIFLIGVFLIPTVLLVTALLMRGDVSALLATAFVVQYLGLVAERWFFFAQARHPQNLYYQSVA